MPSLIFSWLNSPSSSSLLYVQDAGINHKEFGVTSEGVVVYLDVALRSVLKINPNKWVHRLPYLLFCSVLFCYVLPSWFELTSRSLYRYSRYLLFLSFTLSLSPSLSPGILSRSRSQVVRMVTWQGISSGVSSTACASASASYQRCCSACCVRCTRHFQLS
jgi:hypothetical protein